MTAQLDWYGCATFRLTLGSLVIFLDTYIDRIPGAAGTGLRADDIERADWIVVVLPLSVVDNSDFSPNRLTALGTRRILASQGAHHVPHFKQRGF